jgi:ABC-2 type transport system permease protein
MTGRHELRLLWRDSAALVVWLMWCAALLYALATGWQVAERTRADVQAFEAAAQARIQAQQAKVAEAEGTGTVTDRFAGFPSTIRAPAVLPVSPVAFLSVGEMDLQPHTATVSLFTPAGAAAKGQELQSPVTLATGRFDLSYVVVVLMPLVLLALCHNQLAEDREQRRLPMLAAQGGLHRLLWRRLALRGAVVVLPLIIFSGAAAVWQGGGLTAVPAWAAWVAPALAWGLFWLALCGLVGRRAAHGGTAAAMLVSVWLLLVLLLPAALGALVQTVAPVPSPLLAATALRTAEVQAERDRERILGRYISDHPEMKVSTAQDDVAWTRSYYAQMQFVERALQPLRDEARAAAQAHASLRAALAWVSPAQMVEQALQRAAGTDAGRYEAFSVQRARFKQDWDAPLVAPLLAGQTLTVADLDSLPSFTFREAQDSGSWWATAYLITLFAVLLGALWRLERMRPLTPVARTA